MTEQCQACRQFYEPVIGHYCPVPKTDPAVLNEIIERLKAIEQKLETRSTHVKD